MEEGSDLNLRNGKIKYVKLKYPSHNPNHWFIEKKKNFVSLLSFCPSPFLPTNFQWVFGYLGRQIREKIKNLSKIRFSGKAND